MAVKHIHVSFDCVEEFVPRIPEHRCDGEDNTVKRICTAPDIFHAINAMPRGGESLWNMYHLGMPLFFHAYYLTAAPEDIVKNEDILSMVPDAFLTKEEWITSIPKFVRRIDYIIEDPVFVKRMCTNGLELHFLLGGRLKRMKQQDSWELFMQWMTGNPNVPQKLKDGEIPFGVFISNLNDELRKLIVKRKKDNKNPSLI